MIPTAVTTIDAYIATFPKGTQTLLQHVRKTIQKAAPQAEETINYGIPTFKLNGNLVHFGGYKNHIGFYPAPSGIAAFKKELAAYHSAKGSVQFPLDKPVPFGVITKIVQFRVAENLSKPLKTKKATKLQDDFRIFLSAPARRALETKGIKTVQQLSRFSEAQILALHGIGPGVMPKLRAALEAKGLSFRQP